MRASSCPAELGGTAGWPCPSRASEAHPEAQSNEGWRSRCRRCGSGRRRRRRPCTRPSGCRTSGSGCRSAWAACSARWLSWRPRSGRPSGRPCGWGRTGWPSRRHWTRWAAPRAPPLPSSRACPWLVQLHVTGVPGPSASTLTLYRSPPLPRPPSSPAPRSPPALPTQVEREKLRSQEDTVRLSAEKGRLDRTLTGAELELAEAQRQIQLLEVQPLPTQS